MAASLGVVMLAGGGALLAASHSAIAAMLLAAVAVAGIAVVGDSRTRLGKLAAGITAEQRVGRALESLPVTAVVHGALLGAGDVDHVVIGPQLLAVETKYGRGQVQVRNGSIIVGGRTLQRDPLGQARRNAQMVAKAAGAPCTPVLALSEGEGPAVLVDGVWVCSPRTLRDVLSRCPTVLTPAAAMRIREQLSREIARR
jgi:hypothetical protein